MRSIGTSNLSFLQFEKLLESFDIDVVLDVRSRPRSRFPHFSSPQFRVNLNRVGISYLWLGDGLGGLPTGGPTNYPSMALSPTFRSGIARVLEIAARCRPVFLCSEAENLDCHRCLLVGRHLLSCHGIDVEHIRRDGSYERQSEAEERLLSRWNNGGDLFRSREDQLNAAYRLQARKIGVPA
jgi:uncharacterized protein (DUF488 family)